jgi:predicted RNase H-like nuclease
VTPLALGIDGCREGWAVAAGPVAGGVDCVWVARRIGDVMDAVDAGRVVSVAIDMPVGLADRGARVCDGEARKILGPRRSSVFSAPARDVLFASSYEVACTQSRAIAGVALSRQTWNLVPKIVEVDAWVTPARQEVMVEAHPEGSFAVIGDRPCQWPKRVAAGRTERESLVSRVFPTVTSPMSSLPGAAADDVLDALVLLWTAQRRARGEAVYVGDEVVDRRGLKMQIWR